MPVIGGVSVLHLQAERQVRTRSQQWQNPAELITEALQASGVPLYQVFLSLICFQAVPITQRK